MSNIIKISAVRSFTPVIKLPDVHDMQPIKQHIKPAQAVKILAENGLNVTENEASGILDFLYTLAGSTIQQ